MASETKGSSAVEALLKEKRKFPPPKEFAKHGFQLRVRSRGLPSFQPSVGIGQR